jgi:acyl-CoA dehydrogenase
MTTTTSEAGELLALVELADDIFAASTEPVLDVQQVGLDFDPNLWSTLSETGLALLATPESRGGSGAGLRELAVILERSGYHAAPVPLAEHDLLASWLLGVADLSAASALMTAAVTSQRLESGRLSTTLVQVPWANVAETIVVAGDGFIAAVPRREVAVEVQHDIAGQPAAQVTIDTTLSPDQYRDIDSSPLSEFRLRGALARSLQICGALTRALDLARDHAQQREQFGRPIAKFQAVQALLASAAGAISVAETAGQFAVESVVSHGFDSAHARFAVSVAKIETARAATLVSRNTHQVHGAIGFTLDHRLRHFTNRALAWRSEFGSQREWQQQLGQLVLESKTSAWETVTALSSGVAVAPPN